MTVRIVPVRVSTFNQTSMAVPETVPPIFVRKETLLKRIISILLLMAILLSAFSIPAFADGEDDDEDQSNAPVCNQRHKKTA